MRDGRALRFGCIWLPRIHFLPRTRLHLIEQIVRCVAAGTKLASVVAVTFTHAAAGEMKLRLREELGKAGQSSADLELAFVGTYARFANMARV